MELKPPQIATPAYRRGISAAELVEKKFDPINYVVPGLLTEGVTLFGGKPKIGKSWMALSIATAVACGRPLFGNIHVAAGDVLYLALEDSERRLQSRLIKQRVQAPDRLTLIEQGGWPDLDHGCMAEMEAWAHDVERPTLVIVDVLKAIKGSARHAESFYDFDYRTLRPLAEFAKRRRVAVLAVHHVRKMAAEDPLEMLSGTNGLTGAADGVMVLAKRPGTGQFILYVRGRDVEEAEKAVRFNPDNGTWELLGEASEVGRSEERERILALLRSSPKALKISEISAHLGKDYDATRKCLSRMAEAGELTKPERGSYACPISPNVRTGACQ